MEIVLFGALVSFLKVFGHIYSNMGCCGSKSLDSAQVPLKCGRFTTIPKWLEAYKTKSAEIIAQGPFVPFLGEHAETPQQVDLPKTALRLYDMNGNECEFYFQTDSIFSSQKNVANAQEMIFYDEIRNYSLIPLAGYERQYLQMTFSTKYGFRTFYFVPIVYRDAINRGLRFVL